MSASRTKKPIAKTFKATLERPGKPLYWTIVRVPFQVDKVFGSRGIIKVVAEVKGFKHRTSLFPSKDGRAILLVNKKMQKGAGIAPGDTAKFTVTLDLEERKVEIPRELDAIFKQERALRKYYSSLNYSTQKYIADWINEPKSTEARTRRSDQLAERLLSTMEAEQELPPAIKLALARNPKAAEGWARWSPSHRRQHLMAIFYYRTPDARARRIEKTMQEAAEYAEKKTGRCERESS